ncbi:unnamed protein product [Triticum turgidum subsp. durum]|uniref:Fe2OG dioxygenase domain-containing protein n=1 Tax=Triticum turgidum subsp. durum TaxID=4567 RepID=A0A9R0VSX5_TRITD|nr:unnamed protein product [Triticum turgidum subsp. durum]
MASAAVCSPKQQQRRQEEEKDGGVVKIGRVDDVQELQRACVDDVPERYVRDGDDRPGGANVCAHAEIPVIDAGELRRGGGDGDELKKLRRACQEWGFFQVVNHGIDGELLDEMERLSREFFMLPLEHIAETLGLAPSTFAGMFGDAVQAVRMNFYPPCPRPDLVLGLSAHSDGSAVTVLQQDAGRAGLQVLRDGAWVPVHPVPHALVVNLGDSLEVLTNGRYKSVEHRAVTNGEQDRLSIVTFYAPAYDVELGPLPELVADGEACRYRRFKHGEYSRHYVTSKLEGKKTLDFAKIN